MNAYLAAVYKNLANLNCKSTFSSDNTYTPHTKSLSNRIRSWLINLDAEYKNTEFYETDLCLFFKCKKEDLAIASIDIPLYSKVKNINGVKIRSYSAIPFNIEKIELSDVELFFFNCLKRGYIINNSDEWALIINSKKLFETFKKSDEYKGNSRTTFGKNISRIGLAKSVLYGNPPSRCRAFKFKSLAESRKCFSDNVLAYSDYTWDSEE